MTLCIVQDVESYFRWETSCPVVDALNQHLGRWHKLTLYLEKHDLRYFQGIFSLRSPCDLEISRWEVWGNDETTLYFSLDSSPSPARLAIQDYRLSPIDVPWGKVTCLTLKWMPPHDCLYIGHQASTSPIILHTIRAGYAQRRPFLSLPFPPGFQACTRSTTFM